MQILDMLVTYSPYFLILTGIILILDISEWLARHDEDWKPAVTALAVIGFIVGIVDFIILAHGWSLGVFDTATIVIFIIAALALTLAPMSKLPIAGLGALAIGGFAAFFISGFIHNMWIIAIIFILIVVIMFIFFKAIKIVIDIIGKVLGFPLISIPLGIICIIQAVLILLGLSLGIWI
ncbi:MAG: hypothetical protein ACTSQY_10350 [Candidatus Odinarchaeia archaeon]